MADESGKVGIGTTSPSSTLHVYKSLYPEIMLADNNGNFVIDLAQNNGEYATWAKPGDVVFKKHGISHNINFFMNNNNNDGNSYIKFGDAYNGAVLSVFNNAKVAVNGKLTAKEIEVKPNVWADDVFNHDYKLMSLSELEKFIQVNHHLPLVPNEVEIKEKGLNVGEMNAILLRKIEELTKYVIEQEKEMQGFKRELEAIKSK